MHVKQLVVFTLKPTELGLKLWASWYFIAIFICMQVYHFAHYNFVIPTIILMTLYFYSKFFQYVILFIYSQLHDKKVISRIVFWYIVFWGSLSLNATSLIIIIYSINCLNFVHNFVEMIYIYIYKKKQISGRHFKEYLIS